MQRGRLEFSGGPADSQASERFQSVGAARSARTLPPIARVVHCKREKFDVYIGRPSKWGNPIYVKPGYDRASDPERILARYEEYVLSRPDLVAALPELAGKTLGCWCAPRPCHGDVLARLAAAGVIS